MITLEQISNYALAERGTTEATYDLSALVLEQGIAGCFVECGVFAGAQVAAMALAQHTLGLRRKIHLFDSFQGIPKAGPQDGEEGPKIEGKSICSLADVQKFLFETCGFHPGMFEFHVGWFNTTVPGALAGEEIALLRLDADLYASTKICIAEFEPMLALGAWMVVDDYVLPGCRKAVDETIGGKMGPIYYKEVRKRR